MLRRRQEKTLLQRLARPRDKREASHYPAAARLDGDKVPLEFFVVQCIIHAAPGVMRCEGKTGSPGEPPTEVVVVGCAVYRAELGGDGFAAEVEWLVLQVKRGHVEVPVETGA